MVIWDTVCVFNCSHNNTMNMKLSVKCCTRYNPLLHHLKCNSKDKSLPFLNDFRVQSSPFLLKPLRVLWLLRLYWRPRPSYNQEWGISLVVQSPSQPVELLIFLWMAPCSSA